MTKTNTLLVAILFAASASLPMATNAQNDKGQHKTEHVSKKPTTDGVTGASQQESTNTDKKKNTEKKENKDNTKKSKKKSKKNKETSKSKQAKFSENISSKGDSKRK